MCNFSDDNLNYFILKQKTTRRTKKNPRRIQPKDYKVYQVLRADNDWYWESGYNTCNSDKSREQINNTRRKNFHNLAKQVLLANSFKNRLPHKI